MFSDPFLKPVVIAHIILVFTSVITAIYILFLIIKALKIYIKKNS